MPPKRKVLAFLAHSRQELTRSIKAAEKVAGNGAKKAKTTLAPKKFTDNAKALSCTLLNSDESELKKFELEPAKFPKSYGWKGNGGKCKISVEIDGEMQELDCTLTFNITVNGSQKAIKEAEEDTKEEEASADAEEEEKEE